MKYSVYLLIMITLFCSGGCLKTSFYEPTDEINIEASDGLDKEAKQIIDKFTN